MLVQLRSHVPLSQEATKSTTDCSAITQLLDQIQTALR